jgi:phage gp36-like protein
MPFTSEQLITAALDEAQLTILKGEDGEKLTEAIAQADDIVTTYTGIAPPVSAEDAKKILVNVATSIVIWILSGRQASVAEEELDRRKTQYDDAIMTLEKFKNGDLVTEEPAEPTTPAFSAMPRRVEEW